MRESNSAIQKRERTQVRRVRKLEGLVGESAAEGEADLEAISCDCEQRDAELAAAQPVRGVWAVIVVDVRAAAVDDEPVAIALELQSADQHAEALRAHAADQLTTRLLLMLCFCKWHVNYSSFNQ